ncbi:MAG: hypothetical protein IPM61_06890 [Chlorobi bacterium]|nr:MAG: hypothetical protein UZ07_CHB004003154 [Chlorobi bacterium OLB7]MBK8911040.1 hypothetical protein [Chlorobiota bacterium]MBX7216835.1 hypothetical protein [Candidatus Kapabacteria bacterium]
MMQVNFNGRNVRNPIARMVMGAVVVVVVVLLLLLLLSVAGVALVAGGVLLLGLGVRRLLLGGRWQGRKQAKIEEAEVIESIQKTPQEKEQRLLR